MSTYKLTPLEELRLEKKRLREERIIASQRLSYQLQYLNDNWGTMLTKGVASSVRSKLAETVDNLSSGSSFSVTPFVTKRTNPWLNLVMSNLPLIGSLSWKVARPALIAFAVRKIPSMLFGKKRKKIK
ncbi:hypothetical protein PSM36_2440 [Proteiniphilum saccharofermentans]|uniref:Uncharacterized protein n=1 Tax=Proteiniphilum saccharofermentans TaxID=1642647 RepID=A0A1R3SYH4_9BACT|nr:hypothetical protein [Proteiniphilum saccharofermentans]SCD21243.1 hypothetical protein PSM36_2440 [Proteiniphilum saccharofermentans]SDZ85738.1 hypothetical protein SAMN05216331_10734 [Porphyromonadaceae bacterium KH3R12]SFT00795.1 hypothetical protein SAMN05216365_14117 [Porphyromonadaceae bacterium NLAE-zl-C104]